MIAVKRQAEARRKQAAKAASAKKAREGKVAAAGPAVITPTQNNSSNGTLILLIAMGISILLLGIASTPPHLVGQRAGEVLVRRRTWIVVIGIVIPLGAALEWMMLVGLGGH